MLLYHVLEKIIFNINSSEILLRSACLELATSLRPWPCVETDLLRDNYNKSNSNTACNLLCYFRTFVVKLFILVYSSRFIVTSFLVNKGAYYLPGE